MRKDAEGSPLAGEHDPLTGDLPIKTMTGILILPRPTTPYSSVARSK